MEENCCITNNKLNATNIKNYVQVKLRKVSFMWRKLTGCTSQP